MDAICSWAKGLFLLSVFTAAVILVAPKSMRTKVQFVCEIILVLCATAPLLGFVRTGELTLPASVSREIEPLPSLGDFLVTETARRVREIGRLLEIGVGEVAVETDRGGLSLTGIRVTIEADADAAQEFGEALGLFAGIPKDKIDITRVEP